MTGLAAGAVGLVSTGSAAAATYAATVATALTLPLFEHWFKRRELTAEAEWADANEDDDSRRAAVSATGTGALRRALASVVAALAEIEEAATDAAESSQTLERARSDLATALGGGDRIPRLLQRAYQHNGRSCDLLEQVGQELDEAATELNIVCGVIQ